MHAVMHCSTLRLVNQANYGIFKRKELVSIACNVDGSSNARLWVCELWTDTAPNCEHTFK